MRLKVDRRPLKVGDLDLDWSDFEIIRSWFELIRDFLNIPPSPVLDFQNFGSVRDKSVLIL